MLDFLAQTVNLGALLLVALIFVPLERLLPIHSDQKLFRRGWNDDLVYVFLNGALVAAGLLVVAVFALALRERLMPAPIVSLIARQPHWIQAIELIAAADLAVYAVHRLFHASPTLWRLHAVHHSIEELDWLAAHRVHPIDQILTKGASLIPCFMFGFSEWAIAAFFLIYKWHSLLLHANVRIGFGPLRWLIASPRFHHWHHSSAPEARDRNFAGQLVIWDRLFGTAYMPEGRAPVAYGIADPIPAGYVEQLLHPFRRADDTADS